jgi:hypothetical protein
MTDITVTLQGPAPIMIALEQAQGLPGGQGIQGIQGVPGPAAVTFTYTQSMAVALWTIVHNLGKFPSVTVTDSTGRIVEGDPDYIDGNSLTVSFSAPFSGVAYLN